MKRSVLAFLAALAFLYLGFVHPASLAQAPAPKAAAASGAARFNFAGNAAEIPADFTGNVAFLPVSVNLSRSSYFVLDSTAAISSIDPQRAAELGVTNSHAPLLSLHGVDIPFAALPEQVSPNFGSQIGRVYEGTLGNDFFQRVVVEIDYGRSTVRLYDPSAYQYSGQGKSLPLTFRNGIPVVQGKFTEPRGKALEGSFILNTALDASIVI